MEEIAKSSYDRITIKKTILILLIFRFKIPGKEFLKRIFRRFLILSSQPRRGKEAPDWGSLLLEKS
jgi:hypothetical protein